MKRDYSAFSKEALSHKDSVVVGGFLFPLFFRTPFGSNNRSIAENLPGSEIDHSKITGRPMIVFSFLSRHSSEEHWRFTSQLCPSGVFP